MNQTTDNPTCMRCRHYNAILDGECRDCGYRELTTEFIEQVQAEASGAGFTAPEIQAFVLFGEPTAAPTAKELAAEMREFYGV